MSGSPRALTIAESFEQLRARGEAALIPYITAGDPDLETTGHLLRTMAAAGADLIELGIPFSDPTADGPTIQRASERALAAHTTLDGVLSLLERITAQNALPPIVLFGYYNPFLQYGLPRLVQRAARCGVSGFLVVDLPPEESAPFDAALAGSALSLIHLVAPTTPEARMQRIAAASNGFIYYVSRSGVTGQGRPSLAALTERVQLLRGITDLPIAVGFGIREPEQAREIAHIADAVVVGSALVQLVEEHSGAALLMAVERKIRALKDALC